MPTAKTINAPLLRQVERAITAEPLRFEMSTYIERKDDAPCGTAACIAGWALILDRMNKKKIKASVSTIPVLAEDLRADMRKEHQRQIAAVENGDRLRYQNGNEIFQAWGAKVLGLNMKQARALFYIDHWPKRFRDAFGLALGNMGERVKIAVSRIERFIKTKGKE